MREVVMDLESDGLDPSVIWCMGIEDLGTGHYLEFSDHNPNAHGGIAEGLAVLRAADRVWGHNLVGYDLPALRKLHGLELPFDNIWDTLVLCRLWEPDRKGGHGLESYGAPKDFKDFGQWSQAMSDYLRTDVSVTAKLASMCRQRMAEWGNPLAIRLEHEFAHRIAQQMTYGFAFDMQAAQILQAEIAAERAAVKERAFETIPRKWYRPGKVVTPKRSNSATGYTANVPFTSVSLEDMNLGSEDQVCRYFLRVHNWRPKEFTDTGKPKLGAEILGSMPYPEAKLLAEYARLDKLWGQVAAQPKSDGSGGGWVYHVRDDGRIHGYVNSNGAVTGRCTHSRPNTANADKDKRMRALWIAAPGKVLVGCDAEGLELRMLAHYLAHWDKGAYAKAVVSGNKEDGTDPHSLTKKAAGLYSRDNAKTLIYALLYGAGDHKLGLTIKADYLDHLGAPMKGAPANLGKAARQKLFKGIVGMEQLSSLVKTKAKLPGYMKGLDGRRLFVRSQHAALNTLLQGGGAIAMKLALVLACRDLELGYGPHGERWGLVANVHDEIQIECEPGIAESVGACVAHAIKRAGIELNLNVPLAGKYAIGKNWSETH